MGDAEYLDNNALHLILRKIYDLVLQTIQDKEARDTLDQNRVVHHFDANKLLSVSRAKTKFSHFLSHHNLQQEEDHVGTGQSSGGDVDVMAPPAPVVLGESREPVAPVMGGEDAGNKDGSDEISVQNPLNQIHASIGTFRKAKSHNVHRPGSVLDFDPDSPRREASKSSQAQRLASKTSPLTPEMISNAVPRTSERQSGHQSGSLYTPRPPVTPVSRQSSGSIKSPLRTPGSVSSPLKSRFTRNVHLSPAMDDHNPLKSISLHLGGAASKVLVGVRLKGGASSEGRKQPASVHAPEEQDANAEGFADESAIEAWRAGLNLIRTVQEMIRMAKTPIGAPLFRSAIRTVRLINRLSKSRRVLRALKNIFEADGTMVSKSSFQLMPN